MKTILSIILGSTILFGFAQCNSSKVATYKIVKTAHFKISKATYKEWVAGVRGGGSGINVFITIQNLNTDKISLDSMFFRGQKVKVEKKNSLYIGRFTTVANQQKDFIMSGEASDEYGNKAPAKKETFPFDLKDNEVIISYKNKGKLKYFKQVLKKEKPNLYP